MDETLQIRVHGQGSSPTLIYLPGLHGDWTLVSSFRQAVAGKVRFVEFTYPRSISWTLNDYARAILNALANNGVNRGWLLAESFGSQIAWAVVEEIENKTTTFKADGIILAGGFARHPITIAVRLVRFVIERLPTWAVRGFLAVYARYARLRHRHAPETLDAIAEFVQRRTANDIKAMAWRLGLIYENNPSEIVRRSECPLFCLSGFVDPIVPWFLALRWIQRNIPNLRGTKIIRAADHNVLGTAPTQSATQILQWINTD